MGFKTKHSRYKIRLEVSSKMTLVLRNSLRGLDLYDMYGSNHNCQKVNGTHCKFCKINKLIYQKLFRFIYGRARVIKQVIPQTNVEKLDDNYSKPGESGSWRKMEFDIYQLWET